MTNLEFQKLVFEELNYLEEHVFDEDIMEHIRETKSKIDNQRLRCMYLYTMNNYVNLYKEALEKV